MSTVTLQEKSVKRLDSIYRFWRRYLYKFHPEIYEDIQVEGFTSEQIDEKAKKMMPYEYGLSPEKV